MARHSSAHASKGHVQAARANSCKYGQYSSKVLFIVRLSSYQDDTCMYALDHLQLAPD
jgi:hypothetical protein